TAIKNAAQNFKSTAPTSLLDIFENPTLSDATTMVNQINAKLASSGGGGGALRTEPPTTTPDAIGATPDTLKNNPEAVIKAIKDAASVKELAVKATPSEAVSIPMTVAAALENKHADAVVVIASTEASYELPVSVIDAAKLAKDLGVASSELNI